MCTRKAVLVDRSRLSVNTSGPGDAGSIRIVGRDAGGRRPDVTVQNGPGYLHGFDDPADPRNQPHEVAVGLDAGTSAGGRGGSIAIESAPGEGTRVRVLLPAGAAHGEAKEAG